jgi:hypothetical protein
MPAVEYCEMWITIVAYLATLIWHPKIPRHIWWLNPSRDPGLNYINKIRYLLVRGAHGLWFHPTPLIMSSSLTNLVNNPCILAHDAGEQINMVQKSKSNQNQHLFTLSQSWMFQSKNNNMTDNNIHDERKINLFS